MNKSNLQTISFILKLVKALNHMYLIKCCLCVTHYVNVIEFNLKYEIEIMGSKINPNGVQNFIFKNCFISILYVQSKFIKP